MNYFWINTLVIVAFLAIIFIMYYLIYRLRKSKKTYKRLFNSIPVALIVWDQDYKVLDWNKYAEQLFGFKKEEVLGKNFFDFIVPDEIKKELNKVAQNILEMNKEKSTNENITKDGSLITCEWDVIVERDERGNFKRAISMAQDVTEKMKYQKELKESVERLSETNEELYSSNEELEESYTIIENQSGQMRKMIDLFSRFEQNDMELDVFYDEMLSLAMDIMTEADYGSISLINKDEWKFLASSGHSIDKLKELDLHKKDAIIVNKPTIVRNLKDENMKKFDETQKDKFNKATREMKESMIVSVRIDENIFLNISIDIAKESNKSFNDNSILLFQAFQNIASTYLKNQVYSKKIMDSYLDFSKKLATIAEAHDDITGKHINRVGELSAFFADKLDCKEEFVGRIRREAPLHDVGKIFIDNSILDKKGPLTDEEWEIMRKHTILSGKLLSDDFFGMAKQIAFYHHERWDGSGYPFGMKGEEIPLEAQIVSLVDVYDALRDERPYKKAFTHEEAVDIISRGDGRTKPEHFNPKLLKIFLENQKDIEEIFDDLKE
ncbi:MAG: HD domain-containing phosphohydrolase [Thermotogota bacterium]